MLPGLRLMAIGFVCSFVAVFAGLRVAALLNKIHAGLPVMAAQAAQAAPRLEASPTAQPSATAQTAEASPPIRQAPAYMTTLSATASVAPVIYDLRFAANPAAPLLASATPQAIERARPSVVQPTPMAPRIEETFKEFAPETKPADPVIATEPAAVQPKPALADSVVIAAVDAAVAPTLALAPLEPPVILPPTSAEVTLPKIVASATAVEPPTAASLAQTKAAVKTETAPSLTAEPVAPVEVAAIGPSAEPAAQAPGPVVKLIKRAARPLRHKRHLRMARHAAAPAAPANSTPSVWNAHQP